MTYFVLKKIVNLCQFTELVYDKNKFLIGIAHKNKFLIGIVYKK